MYTSSIIAAHYVTSTTNVRRQVRRLYYIIRYTYTLRTIFGIAVCDPFRKMAFNGQRFVLGISVCYRNLLLLSPHS